MVANEEVCGGMSGESVVFGEIVLKKYGVECAVVEKA